MLTEKCLAIAGIEGTKISDEIEGTLQMKQMTIKINKGDRFDCNISYD